MKLLIIVLLMGLQNQVWAQTMPYIDVTKSHLKSSALHNNTMDAAAIDIDNDGDLDLVLAMEYVENVILINDGKGVLSDESSIRLPRIKHDSEDIAVADFDKDGDYDLVFVSEDDKVNEYYENIGNGYFESRAHRIPVTGTSNTVQTADFNNDGFMDLLIGNAGQNYLLLNTGKGYFKDDTKSRLPKNYATTQDLALADLDGDGDLDIIEANETYNRILLNNGFGVFIYASAKRLPSVNDQTRDVEVGDIDGDGDLDILFSNVDFGNIGNPQNRLLLNDGKGVFEETTNISLPQSDFRTVDSNFVDMNGDGFLDILSGNRFNGNKTLVLINDGNSHFSDQTTSYFPSLNMYVFDFVTADFNGDGMLDIYLCGFRGSDRLLFGTR